MRKSRLKNAVYQFLTDRGQPTSINMICDEFARRKGCMSATGMGRLLKSDGRFEKMGDGWYLSAEQAKFGMNVRPIWVISLLINLFAVWENIRFDITSKAVLALNIVLIVLCFGMLLKNQIKDLILRFRDTQSDEHEKRSGKGFFQTKITNNRQLELTGAPRLENQ